MISRRNFFTIVTLMFALFFLCMGTNNLKDWLNDYTVNTYTDTAEDYPSKINMYIPESAASGEAAEEETDGGTEERALYASRDRVVLIGDEDGIYGMQPRNGRSIPGAKSPDTAPCRPMRGKWRKGTGRRCWSSIPAAWTGNRRARWNS